MRVITAIACLCLIKVSSAFFGFTSKYNTHQEPFQPHTNRFYFVDPFAVQEKWIEQRLDHFNPQDQRRWQMRYLENDMHYQEGGPIFIHVGGEWTISSGSINAGSLIYDLAKEHNGTLYYTEHRFYGRSHPLNDTSTENLRFLTVDQALADLAIFVNHVKNVNESFANSSVILVGASYSATMVAWMRKKYPHLITGAWASSAPLNAKLDFYEYKEVMTNSIRRLGGDDCSAILEGAFVEMENLILIENTSRIDGAFELCDPLDITNDAAHLLYELSDIVAGLIQGHRPGSIERACDFMREVKSDSARDDLDAFAAWVRRSESSCLNMSYAHAVEKFRNTDWSHEANYQMRQWTYQTCTEYAWFQTSTSRQQIFGSSYPVDYFVQLCDDLYDFTFNVTTVEHNIARTNVRYGGFDLSLTNVYFTHGDLDPWHPMGILEDLNEDTLVTVIPFAAHCADLGSISSSDSDEMRASKEKVLELVHQWLGSSQAV